MQTTILEWRSLTGRKVKSSGEFRRATVDLTGATLTRLPLKRRTKKDDGTTVVTIDRSRMDRFEHKLTLADGRTFVVDAHTYACLARKMAGETTAWESLDNASCWTMKGYVVDGWTPSTTDVWSDRDLRMTADTSTMDRANASIDLDGYRVVQRYTRDRWVFDVYSIDHYEWINGERVPTVERPYKLDMSKTDLLTWIGRA